MAAINQASGRLSIVLETTAVELLDPTPIQQTVRAKNQDIVASGYAEAFAAHSAMSTTAPLLLAGDALKVLQAMPSESIDFAMTSPPYWGKREYDNGGIGLEDDYRDFVKDLTAIFFELKRVLKSTGSFWLNLGDTYSDKGLVGIPWRVVFELTDNQGWILRNNVVWNKMKGGMDNSKDRLGNVHENVFHLVKQPKGYYYEASHLTCGTSSPKTLNGERRTSRPTLSTSAAFHCLPHAPKKGSRLIHSVERAQPLLLRGISAVSRSGLMYRAAI